MLFFKIQFQSSYSVFKVKVLSLAPLVLEPDLTNVPETLSRPLASMNFDKKEKIKIDNYRLVTTF